jgi:hypothetical protein
VAQLTNKVLPRKGHNVNNIGSLILPGMQEEDIEDENSIKEGSFYGGKNNSGSGFDDWDKEESVKDTITVKSPLVVLRE